MWGDIGRGLLTGQFRSPDDFEDGDFRKYTPRFSKEVSLHHRGSYCFYFIPALVLIRLSDFRLIALP
jgi:hypothetical protein